LVKLLDTEVPGPFKIGNPFLLFWCRQSWVIWWSTELAPFESGRCSQSGCGEVEKRRSLTVLWHFQALCKEDHMCLSPTAWM
jgi:hypothetical protein